MHSPIIDIVNQSTLDLGVDGGIDHLISALRVYVHEAIWPAWGVRGTLRKSRSIHENHWAVVFLDDADQPDALGYHDVTAAGMPLSKIFVRTTIANGDKVSVTAAHELAEMLVDPGINLCASSVDGRLIYALEVCDPVESDEFDIDGVAMSDLVTPQWFEGFHPPASVKFDLTGAVDAPFTLSSGGYIPIFKGGRWTEIFGSTEKREKFAKEDRRGHRSTYRRNLSDE